MRLSGYSLIGIAPVRLFNSLPNGTFKMNSFYKANLVMRLPLRRFLLVGSLIFFLLSSVLAIEIAIATAGDVIVISDVQEWKHPVKDVLKKHNVVIYKVELHHKTYPIFYVSFPNDPWFGQNDKFFKLLYYETLKANGFWDYSFIDQSFGCKVNIKWDKKSKTLTESVDELR
jgi:hypothetical protein